MHTIEFMDKYYKKHSVTERIIKEDNTMWIPFFLMYLFALLFVVSLCRLQCKDIMSSNFETAQNPQASRCPNCMVVKRPDIQHCDECEACIEGYDHHCGVVGMCIGDVNFKYFTQVIVYSGL
mmetsp:Transcript_29451/g.44614  ORF Transcript_29451/g.44614 Transcript_29451/m.44614 type:complete len:122 (+) Transcript_29451:327-692(+)